NEFRGGRSCYNINAGNPLMVNAVVIFRRGRTPPRTSSLLFVGEVSARPSVRARVAGSLLSVPSSAFLLSALVNPCNPGGGTLSHSWPHVIWPPVVTVVSQQQREGEEAVT